MPIRYVTVPADVKFKDPTTGDPMKNADGEDEVLTFGNFLIKLMHNPVWAESLANMKAQDEIMSAWEECKERADGVLQLSEDEWTKLKATVDNPRVEVFVPGIGAQLRAGYGYHPSVSRQLVPLACAIVDAPTKDPRKKAVPLEKVERVEKIAAVAD